MKEYSEQNPEMSKIIEESKEREKQLHGEEFKKERDKRIRKMIVDLKKNKLESEIFISERKLLDKLTLESKQEEEIRWVLFLVIIFRSCLKFENQICLNLLILVDVYQLRN